MKPRGRNVAFLAALLTFITLVSLPSTSAVKRHDFKTCDQAGFCRRNRARADRAAASASAWTSPYSILSEPRVSHGQLTASLGNAVYPDVQFELAITLAEDGVARIKVDQVDGLRQRYNEAAKWALVREPVPDPAIKVSTKEGATHIQYGRKKELELILEHKPLKATFLREGQVHIILNERGLFNMEHFRIKVAQKGDEAQEQEPLVTEEGEVKGEVIDEQVADDGPYKGFRDESEDGWWEESFGGKTDSKPKGPESLSLDITFPGYPHLFGIPQHAAPLSLKPTRGTPSPSQPAKGAFTDPYRLFNADVFEYEHDSEMSIYGAIPFLQAARAGSSVAVFYLNAAETWIDVEKTSTSSSIIKSFKGAKTPGTAGDKGPSVETSTTHWMSESGILDLFVFLGPAPADIFASFGSYVGTTALPPISAIEYHQCRWNYVSQEDVLEVVKKFDEADLPLGTIWLDIEYAEEHKYFIWDPKTFPEPEKMVKELEATGRKLVTIVDPHIKRTSSLHVYAEAQELGILCKNPDGNTEYEGWCWTGSSSWVDYFDPKSWDWWAGLFKFDKFKGTTRSVHNWLDMNEPSIFNGPEITMPRDNVHYGGWEHRDLHNLNGMVTHNQSVRGLRERTDPPMRGFVLSRAFFAGTQRYGAIWQGDNMGTWEHLAVSIPMLLSNGIAGMAFNGADVGGFFGNPSHEMLVRWYQAGAFMPFFRAHAHIDTKRREPYLFEQPIQGRLRDMMRLRYSLLVTWYTAFFENSISGQPIARPMYSQFPEEESGFAVDDQFFVGGSGLLVKPVVQQGAVETEVYLPDDEPYYNYFTKDVFFGQSSGGSRFKFPAPLDTLPLFLRGGHIVPRRDLIRRAGELMWRDPISLFVGVGLDGSARGTLYLDDGESFDNEKGYFVYRQFELIKESKASFTLRSSDLAPKTETCSTAAKALAAYDPANPWAQKVDPITLAEVTILGLPAKPTCVKVMGQATGLDVDWKAGLASTSSRRKGGLGQTASVLTIKNAGVKAAGDWSIVITTDGAACSVTPAVPRFAGLQSPECPTGQFRCANPGHIPSCILFSRVNDGICDPECCDGSDETDGKVSCPNRCKEVGAAHRKAQEAEARKYRVGGKERQNYIVQGRREKAKLEESVSALEVEIATLKDRERVAKATLERTEASEAQEIERKKGSALYKRIKEHQEAIRILRKQREDLEAGLKELTAILTDLKKGYNPNYQDMAVKGAVKGFEEWEKSLEADAILDGSDAESTLEGNPATTPASTTNDRDISDEDLTRYETEDPLVLMSSLEPDDAIGKTASDSASTFRPAFESLRQGFLDLLGTAGIRLGESRKADAPPSTPDRPDIIAARTAFQDAEQKVKEAEKKIDEAKEALGQDWGREWEFKKLDKECFSAESGEYTYEVCMFDQAWQKSSNGQKTSLGRFSRWNDRADAGTDEYYMQQVYDQGARCWNGPERSVHLDIACGTTNALLSVMEPEKCEYHLRMTSPAVCFPTEAPRGRSQPDPTERSGGKEEL